MLFPFHLFHSFSTHFIILFYFVLFFLLYFLLLSLIIFHFFHIQRTSLSPLSSPLCLLLSSFFSSYSPPLFLFFRLSGYMFSLSFIPFRRMVLLLSHHSVPLPLLIIVTSLYSFTSLPSPSLQISHILSHHCISLSLLRPSRCFLPFTLQYFKPKDRVKKGNRRVRC